MEIGHLEVQRDANLNEAGGNITQTFITTGLDFDALQAILQAQCPDKAEMLETHLGNLKQAATDKDENKFTAIVDKLINIGDKVVQGVLIRWMTSMLLK
jgi:hypothetical protein